MDEGVHHNSVSPLDDDEKTTAKREAPHPSIKSQKHNGFNEKVKRVKSKKRETPGARKSTVCTHEGCNYNAPSFSALEVHTRVHTGERPFRCTFPMCDFRAAAVSNLRQHVNNRHEKKSRPYKCTHPGCNYSAYFFAWLKNHEKIHRNHHHVKSSSTRAALNWTPLPPQQEEAQDLHRKKLKSYRENLTTNAAILPNLSLIGDFSACASDGGLRSCPETASSSSVVVGRDTTQYNTQSPPFMFITPSSAVDELEREHPFSAGSTSVRGGDDRIVMNSCFNNQSRDGLLGAASFVGGGHTTTAVVGQLQHPLSAATDDLLLIASAPSFNDPPRPPDAHFTHHNVPPCLQNPCTEDVKETGGCKLRDAFMMTPGTKIVSGRTADDDTVVAVKSELKQRRHSLEFVLNSDNTN